MIKITDYKITDYKIQISVDTTKFEYEVLSVYLVVKETREVWEPDNHNINLVYYIFTKFECMGLYFIFYSIM